MSDLHERNRRESGFELVEPPDRVACSTSTDPTPDTPARSVPSLVEQAPTKRGPQFTDMFELAMSGPHLADSVSVTAADGSPMPVERTRPPATRPRTPVATGASTRSAEIGPFSGASARRRRRWSR